MTATVHKGYTAGTHRVRPPGETWAWLAGQLATYGITRIADLTGLDDIGIPVFQAVRPAGRTLSVAQGKGLTPILARVSAAMEAIEFWHAENVTADDPPVTARSLGPLPYAPGSLAPAYGSFYHDDLPIAWLPAVGLDTGATVPVPFGCVRLDYTVRPQWTPPVFAPSSNGLASGNTVDEATVHALCELIERDSTGLLESTPPDRRLRLDLDSVADGYCRDLLDRFARAGATLDVHYSAGRAGPHTFHVIGHSPTPPTSYGGFGCHPDPGVALSRALTEAAQSRLTVIAGSRDDDEHPRWTVPPPVPPTEGRPLAWTTLADESQSTVEDDLAALIRRVVRATGVEPVRVVLPSPTGVPVVKVFAPGLRPFTGHGSHR